MTAHPPHFGTIGSLLLPDNVRRLASIASPQALLAAPLGDPDGAATLIAVRYDLTLQLLMACPGMKLRASRMDEQTNQKEN